MAANMTVTASAVGQVRKHEPITIDHHAAIKALRECVQERGPDFVYERGEPGTESGRCLNWHGDPDSGEPGCIVGMALHKLGVPAEVLCGVNLPKGIYDLDLDPDIDMTYEARDVFFAAQERQDRQVPWGEALTAAEFDYRKFTNRFKEKQA